MKFAFTTADFPDWDQDTVITAATACACDGVELHVPSADASNVRPTLPLGDPAAVRAAFDAAKLEVACVSSPIAMSGAPAEDVRQADRVRGLIDMAAAIGSPLVRVLDARLLVGWSRPRLSVALSDWLLPLADAAADRGVTMTFANAITFRAARDVWTVLERTNHPAIGCCWDVVDAASSGEPSTVSVPVLNQKIRHVHLAGAKRSGDAYTRCQLGEGDLAVERAVTRLRGIGYRGYLTLAYGGDRTSTLRLDQASLAKDVETLRRWALPPAPKPPAPKPPAKAAHKK